MPIPVGVAGLLAGILSTLSPCVFPLLPVVIGASTTTHRSGAYWLAAGVATSFTAAGLFVATIGFAIGLDGDLFRMISAVLLLLLGLGLLSSTMQARLGAAAGGLTRIGDRLIRRVSLTGPAGQFIVGSLFGLVWSPCVGPTLGAASILAAQGRDLTHVAAVMFAFGIGSTLPMLAVALISRAALQRRRTQMLYTGQLGKIAMGLGAVAVGALILTGFDRTIETGLVGISPSWLTDLTTRFRRLNSRDLDDRAPDADLPVDEHSDFVARLHRVKPKRRACQYDLTPALGAARCGRVARPASRATPWVRPASAIILPPRSAGR